MKHMSIYLLVIVSVFFSNCDKDTPLIITPPVPPTQLEICDIVNSETDLNVDWCSLLHPDTTFVAMTAVPELYNGQLIMIGSIGAPGENQFIYVYDTNNGSIINRIAINQKRRTGYHMTRFQQFLIMSYFSSGIEVYNLDTHELVWSYEPISGEKNSQWINVKGSEIIVPIIQGDLPYHDVTIVAAFDITTGARRNIFTVSKSELNGGSPHIESVQIDTLNNGDVIHYFALAKLQIDVIETHSFWAYNETKGEYLWKQNELDELIVHKDPPIIFGDAVTVIGTNTHTMNKNTGEIINSIDIAGNYGFCAPQLYEGRIYAKAAQDDLICLDASTGELIWYNDDAGQFPQNDLTIYKDRIYYSGFQETLYIFDIANGQIIYEESTPFSQGRFHIGGQVIDPATDYMYTNDGFRVMRLELLR